MTASGDPLLARLFQAVQNDDAAAIRGLGRACDFTKPGMGALLHMTVTENRRACARALLEAGAPPDRADATGRTPLWCAAWNGDHETVALLLEYRANPDIADYRGETALHAAAHGGLRVAMELVAAGADVTRTDKSGLTAMERATRNAEERLAFAQSPFVETAVYLKRIMEERAAAAAREAARQAQVANDFDTLRKRAPAHFKLKPRAP